MTVLLRSWYNKKYIIMCKSTKYQSASSNVTPLGSVVPKQLVEDTTKALSKLKVA